MTDFEAIQGLWKVVSIVSQGRPVGHGYTHYEFEGNRVKQIDPSFVDGGKWGTFLLDETATPKRIDTTYEHEDTSGGILKIIHRRTHKECYELTGDILRIGGSPVFGQYPSKISDAISMVTTLSRWRGERPRTKRSSGKAAMENAVLGTVTWDDNFDQWEVLVELFEDQVVNMTIAPKNGDDMAAIAAGAELIEWLRTHDDAARRYAAAEMLELAEEWRDDEEEPEPITAEAFAKRIVLGVVTLEADGTASLRYDDDEIFAGHSIVVSVNAAREFTDAQMTG